MLRRLSALLLVAAVVFSGCSDDDKPSGGSSSGTPEEVIAAAKTKLDDTSGVKVSLKTDELPDGITAIREATGVGVHPSAFEGDLDLTYQGLPTTAEVIAVDGTTYIKNALLLPRLDRVRPGRVQDARPGHADGAGRRVLGPAVGDHVAEGGRPDEVQRRATPTRRPSTPGPFRARPWPA